MCKERTRNIEIVAAQGFRMRGSRLSPPAKRNGHDFSSCPFLLAVELFRTSPILAKERSRVSYPGPLLFEADFTR